MSYGGRKRAGLLVCAALVAAGTVGPLGSAGPIARAADGDVGYVDHSYAGVDGVSDATTYHSQSKTWFHDETWWSVMFRPRPSDPAKGDWTIHRLARETQEWVDTGVVVDDDDRKRARLDVVSDGDELFVVSSLKAAAKPVKVYAFDYVPDADPPYQLATEVTTPATGIQLATITRDSKDELWVAYAADNAVRYMTSVDGYRVHTLPDGGAPPIAGAPGAGLDRDDVVVVTSFGDDRIGVMWSRSDYGDGGFFFAHRQDGEPLDSWSEPEKAWAGEPAYVGDNHLSLKAASDGRVFAAVKTSYNRQVGDNESKPLIALLARDTAGTWRDPVTVSTVAAGETRPLLVLDESEDLVNVFVTKPAAKTEPTKGGDILRRTAPLAGGSFGAASVFIHNADHANVNDATDSKQPATATSGVMVQASDKFDKVYLHNCLGAACAPSDTATTLEVTPAGPATSPASVRLTATVSSAAGAPTGTVTFVDNGASLGTVPLRSDGTADLSSTLPTGGHELRAEFTPSTPLFGASTSAPVTYDVLPEEPTPSPSPSPTQSPTQSPSQGPSPTMPAPSPTPTPTTPSPTPTPSITDSATPVTLRPAPARFAPLRTTRTVLRDTVVRSGRALTVTLPAPRGATAVSTNLRVTKATKTTSLALCAGDMSARACRAETLLTVGRGERAAAFAVTPLATGQRIKILNRAGRATVSLDVQGWWLRDAAASRFTKADRRLADRTRLTADEAVTLTVPRRIRPAGTTAVVLDVEARRATADTAVSACTWRRGCLGTPHLYVSTAAAASNRIILPLRRDGTVILAAETGTLRVTVDVVGAYRRG